MKSIEVVAAIIKDNDSILVTKRKSGKFQDLWEFPGGKIEQGESRVDALVREIDEELNLRIQVGELLLTINHSYPDFELIMHTYWCEILGGTLQLNDHNDAKWVSPSELKDLDWVPADVTVVDKILKSCLSDY